MLGGSAHGKRRWLVLVAFACTYFFWGSAFVALRYSVQKLHPAFVAGFRYVLAGLLILGFLLARGHTVRISRKELLQLTMLGLIMFTCNTVLLGYGSRVLSAGITALIISTIPLFMALLEASLPDGTGMSALGWSGTFTGFLGVLVLFKRTLHGGTLTRETFLAIMALLLAAFAWATGSVLTRRLKFTAPPLVCSSWQMLIGGTAALLIGAGLGEKSSSEWTLGGLLSLFYLAVFCTLAGYTSYMYLLRNVSLPAAATYAYVNPIVAVLLGWVLLGETLAPTEWLGMAIVLASVALVIMANARPRRLLAEKRITT